MPTNPVVPLLPTNPSTGHTPSGTDPASGLGGAYTGPWFVEQQSMEIEYVRAPFIVDPLGYLEWSLSGNMATAQKECTLSGLHKINYTQLFCIVKASYSVTKDNETYDTSTWTEGQTFRVEAYEKDTYGNSYGTLTSANLGPMGSIVTDVPWYRRRAWDSKDKEVKKSIIGTNAYFISYPFGWEACFSTSVECPNAQTFKLQSGDFTNFNNTMQQSFNPMSMLAADQAWIQAFPTYVIPGTYALDKESEKKISMTTNFLGGYVKVEQLFKLKATIGKDRDNKAEWNMPVQNHGIAEYNHKRHKWN